MGDWLTRPYRSFMPRRNLPAGSTLKQFPRISVVTPSYNQGRFIEETIESVLDQDYGNVEYIIMDGGSSDETVSIIERYADRIDFWTSAKDAGQSDAIGRGFARATGDIFAWINSDDALAPGALSAVANAFTSSDADIVAGVVSVYQDNQLVYHHRTGCQPGRLRLEELLDLENSWMTGRYFYQPEVFFSRDIYERAGGMLDQSLHYSMDYDLWLRCAKAGARIMPIDYQLARFRMHADQKTSSVDAFVPELTRHANNVRATIGLQPVAPPATPRPTRAARIGMINDFGFRYGAGRAHRRMAQCLAAAQYEVSYFSFREDVSDEQPCTFSAAVEAMRAAEVDAVIIGNLHGAFPEGVDLAPLADVAPVLLVTHDFFLFTGRCPYPLGCDGYLLSCPPTCPTREQYPVIPFDDIPVAHARKLANIEDDRIFVLANSRYMERSAIQLLAVKQPGSTSGQRVRHVSLSIPEPAFRPRDRNDVRTKFGLTDDEIMVLTSSSDVMDRRKGFLHVVEACKLAADPRLRLFALGWVDPYHRLEGITYLGHIDDDDDLARCFAAADVFVSAPADETFGQVFVEAAMCGCPSITYGVGGVGEVVIPGQTGWLVDRNDIAGLGGRLREVAEMDSLSRQGMRDRAHLHATSRWGAASFLAAANDVLRSIIADPDVKIPSGVQYGGIRALPIARIEGYRVKLGAAFALPEGPFPEHGINRRLQWMIANEATLILHTPRAAPALLTLTLANVHVTKHVTLDSDSAIVAAFDLMAEPWSVSHEVQIVLDLPKGTTTLTLSTAGAMQTPDRDLYLAVFEATLHPTTEARGLRGMTRHALDGPEHDTVEEARPDKHEEQTIPGIMTLSGFRDIEGPYPEAGISMRLAWLVGAAGKLTVADPVAEGDTLVLDVKLPSPQNLTVRVDGVSYPFADLEPDEWDRPTRLVIALTQPLSQAHEIALECDSGVVDAAGDTLRLAVIGAAVITGQPHGSTDRYGVDDMPMTIRTVESLPIN